MPTLNELSEALRAQLAEILIGGDDKVKPSSNSFVTWFSPGVPFEATDFDFASKGLGSGATAEEEKRLLDQSYLFSTLVDFAPDASGLLDLDQQQTIYRSAQNRMSQMYGEILKLARVADEELTPKQQAKLENWRSKLQTTKTVKDLVTDEEKQITEDSPLVKEYNKYMAAFWAARTNYNSKRIMAEVATGVEGKQAVEDWKYNGTMYRDAAHAALQTWIANGYKNEVDQLRAAIDGVTGRSMRLWVDRLKKNLADSEISGLLPGSAFYPATLAPSNFVASSGWTKYGLTSSHLTESLRDKSTSWEAGGGFNMGLWRASANAKKTDSTHDESKSLSSFEISFELAQVAIIRPWFYPEFFKNRGWDLQAGHGWTYSKLPSNGARPPDGLLIGYPTMIIFARNIRIKSAEMVQALSTYAKSLEAGGSVGYGPFSVKGKYARSESGRDFDSKEQGETLEVPGMQAIAQIVELIPKSPDLHPDLKPENLV
jgi:hypothetical protein